jgi:hypothetical protein
MKKFLNLVTLSLAAGLNAFAQDEGSLELRCAACAPNSISPDVCEARLQKQVDDDCYAQGGGAGLITKVQVIHTFAGGFCFDGTHGGRMMGSRNLVTFSCTKRL